MIPLFLSLMLACGPKKAPESPVATAPTTPPVPVAAAEPEPEPEPAAPKDVVNADFSATVVSADGTMRAGKVKRIERSTDWFGEEGWSTEASDLVLSLESGAQMKTVKWTEVKSVTVTPGKVPTDVDCYYDSDWSPWMYDCTLKTSASVTLKDASVWQVTNRHKWKFVYIDDTEAEFWLAKHPARAQDEDTVTLDTVDPENYDLYTRLQNRLRDEVKTTLVTKVTIQ